MFECGGGGDVVCLSVVVGDVVCLSVVVVVVVMCCV